MAIYIKMTITLLLLVLICQCANGDEDPIVKAVLEHPSGGIVMLQRGKSLLVSCDLAIRSGLYDSDKSAMCKLHLARAYALAGFSEDRFDEIINAVENAVAADSSNPQARIHEAFVKYVVRNEVDVVKKVAIAFPDNPYAILLTTRVMVKDDPRAALKTIQRVLGTSDLPRPAMAEAYHQEAMALAKTGHYDRAIDSLSNCMIHGGTPSSSPLGFHTMNALLETRLLLAYHAGRFEVAEADALELIYRHPGQPVFAHALIVTQMDLGRPVTAAAAADSINQQFPTYSQRPILLAAAYNRVNRHKDAITALTGYTHDAASLTELALALWLNGNRPSAIEKLDAAVGKEKEFAPAFALRAVLRATDPKVTAEEKKLAAADAEAALKLDPNGSFNHVAKMLTSAASDDLPTAAAAAETALKRSRRPQAIKDEIAKARDAYKAKRPFVPSAELILSVPSYRLPALSAK